MADVPVIMTPCGARIEFEPVHGPMTVPLPHNPTPMQTADAIRRATHPTFVGIVHKARRLAWDRFNYAYSARRWVGYLNKLLNP